ncbi:MAG: serine/threonine-protein kinase, partial [Nocardioides sp.]
MAHFPSVGEDFGAYRITRQLGRGGMGVVFAAEQVGLGRTVALKVLSPDLAEQDDYRQRFAREASVLARVDSPHIISIFDHGEHDGCLYIATQYVAGGDLSVALEAHGPVPAAQACEVAAQLALALSDAHQAGVVHRDLKPSNVLLRSISSDVFAYLCDFGIAQDRSPGLTVPGAVAGTFAYLAPERTRGEPATPAADLYALGCVLWTALTARTPYAGTDVEIGMAHVSAPVPQLVESSSVAAAINALLRTAMAKQPAARFPSADAMRSALQEVARLARSTPHPPLVPRAQDVPAVPPTRPAQPSHPSHPSGAPVPPPPPAPLLAQH